MNGEGTVRWVERLAEAGPPDAKRFATLLGVTLQPDGENPDWSFYRFEWPIGPWAGGLVRVNRSGDAALLSLSPRDPPGLTEADLDTTTWGMRHDAVPMPRISTEGADLFTHRLGGLVVAVLLTHTSRRLVNLTLEWPAPVAPVEGEDLALL